MQLSKGTHTGPEAYILAVALLLPLALMALAVTQLPGASFGVQSTLADAHDSQPLVAGRPAPLNSAPPPTLAPPTATPRPTAVPPTATAVASAAPTPQAGRTYTVQSGDELKQIAASYGVSIWKIIDANHLPNPDSLSVGQVLQIPDN
jgi:LysM repeat protein